MKELDLDKSVKSQLGTVTCGLKTSKTFWKNELVISELFHIGRLAIIVNTVITLLPMIVDDTQGPF